MKIFLILLIFLNFSYGADISDDEIMCILYNRLSYRVDIEMLIGDGNRITFYKTEVIDDKKVMASDFKEALTALPFPQGDYQFGSLKIYRLFCDKKSIWLNLIHPPYLIEKKDFNDVPLGSYIEILKDEVLS
jgi:hypothetical protein